MRRSRRTRKWRLMLAVAIAKEENVQNGKVQMNDGQQRAGRSHGKDTDPRLLSAAADPSPPAAARARWPTRAACGRPTQTLGGAGWWGSRRTRSPVTARSRGSEVMVQRAMGGGGGRGGRAGDSGNGGAGREEWRCIECIHVTRPAHQQLDRWQSPCSQLPAPGPSPARRVMAQLAGRPGRLLKLLSSTQHRTVEEWPSSCSSSSALSRCHTYTCAERGETIAARVGRSRSVTALTGSPGSSRRARCAEQPWLSSTQCSSPGSFSPAP